MQELVTLADEWGGDGRFVLKETSAQHFRGTGSYTLWEQGHTEGGRDNCACEGMNQTVAAENWGFRQVRNCYQNLCRIGSLRLPSLRKI